MKTHMTIWMTIISVLLAACGGGGGDAGTKARPVAQSPGDHCSEIAGAFDGRAVLPMPRPFEFPAISRGEVSVAVLDAGAMETLPLPPGLGPRMAEPVLQVPVLRAGDLSGALSLRYYTRPGSASEYEDYSPASGEVRFAAGQSLAHVRVALRNDTLPECPETFDVVIESAVPHANLVRAVATISVLDDADARDFGPGAPTEPEGQRVRYCEVPPVPGPAGTAACRAVDCATGETLAWTQCPAGRLLADLLT